MRVKVILSYDGSKFSGFQQQNSGVKTVANRVDKILKSLGIFTKIRASGRTDSGVHALNQVIDFNLPPFWKDLKKLKKIINSNSLPEIFIKDIKIVDENFHSRYRAKRRVYRYILSTQTPNVFMTNYMLFIKEIDEKAIKSAIKEFEGEHDFSLFKKSKGGEKNSIRNIYKSKFYKHKDIYVFTFEADGYLRSQIRMMVYFLLEISSKKLTIFDLKEQLECEKKHSFGLVLPCGLYLSSIKY